MPSGPGQDREAHVDRRVDDVLVALRDLVVGQAGAAPPAVRSDAEVAYEQALGVDLGERPPDRLDVAGAHRPVGGVGVDPVAHAAGEALELVDVAGHRLAAALVELGDAELLDLRLARDAELLLDRDLDGEAVAVPTGDAGHVSALHRLVAGEDVLEGVGLDVVRPGEAVRGGRALEERPALLALARLERPLEDALRLPPVQERVLHRDEVELDRRREPPEAWRGRESSGVRHGASHPRVSPHPPTNFGASETLTSRSLQSSGGVAERAGRQTVPAAKLPVVGSSSERM